MSNYQLPFCLSCKSTIFFTEGTIIVRCKLYQANNCTECLIIHANLACDKFKQEKRSEENFQNFSLENNRLPNRNHRRKVTNKAVSYQKQNGKFQLIFTFLETSSPIYDEVNGGRVLYKCWVGPY
jgi:spore maturation protein CgeB